MSNFKEALSVCGLSSAEAAVFLNLSKSTVDSMMSGRRPVSHVTWRKLSDLWQKIRQSADETLDSLRTFDDEGIDPRSSQVEAALVDGLPHQSRGAAAAIAAMEMIASLPLDMDNADSEELKPILLPGTDIKIPEAAGGRIGWILSRGRWYEQEMLEYIRSLGISGNYLDVGANIGNHSVFFATNTNADRVFSFEPTRDARGVLNKFIELNNLWQKMSTIPYACSDFNGEVEVVETLGSGKAPIKYPCRKIDDLITTPVSLIKIDIEGAEPTALRGATRVLNQYRPILFVEAHDDKTKEEIMEIITPIGYKPTGKVWNHSPTYEFVAQ